jgi:hypothetical protein
MMRVFIGWGTKFEFFEEFFSRFFRAIMTKMTNFSIQMIKFEFKLTIQKTTHRYRLPTSATSDSEDGIEPGDNARISSRRYRPTHTTLNPAALSLPSTSSEILPPSQN